MHVCFASFQITDQTKVLNESQKPYSVAQICFPSSFISSPPWDPRPLLAFPSLSGDDSASHFTGHRLHEPSSPPSLHQRALHLTTPLLRKACSAQGLFIQWLFTITTPYSFAPFPTVLLSHANSHPIPIFTLSRNSQQKKQRKGPSDFTAQSRPASTLSPLLHRPTASHILRILSCPLSPFPSSLALPCFDFCSLLL